MSLLTNLVSYWNLDNNVLDAHGPNNGTAYNLTYVAGHSNQAITGNGVSSWVDIGVGTGLNIVGDLTVAAWCYRTSANYHFIICRTTGSGAGASTYEFRIEPGGNLAFLTTSGAGSVSGGSVPYRLWTHIAATRSGTTCKVFIDGMKVATATGVAASTSLPAENTIIGSRQDGPSHLGDEGWTLDDVGIWDRALTDEEIRDLWSVSAGYPLTPVPFYPFFVSAAPYTDTFFNPPFENVFVADIITGSTSVFAAELDFPSRGAVSEPIFQTRMAEPYGGSVVVVAPVVGNMIPASGTPIYPTTPIQFDVTDDSGLFTAIIVMVSFPDGAYEVVHDSAQFAPRYRSSTVVPIVDGFQFVCRRNGGWPSSPTIKVVGVDAAGGENPQ